MLKKNIAKLLVFAMILSMLPFSAVSVGAATRVDEKLGDYVSFDSNEVKVKQGDQTYTLSCDSETGLVYTLADDATVLPNKTVTVSFKASIVKDGETAKAAGLRIKQGNKELTFKEENEESTKVNETGSYTVNGDTYTVTCDVSVTANTDGFCEVPFTFTAIPAEGNNEITLSDNLTLKLKVYEDKSPEPDDKEYSITLDTESVTVKVGDSTTLTPKLTYGDEDVTKKASFTYQILNDAKTVKLEGGTLTGVKEGSAQILVSAYVTSNDTSKEAGEKVADATKIVSVKVDPADEKTNKHKITYTSNPDNGTVKVEAEGVTGDVISNSTEVEAGKKVTITAKPTDSTAYALNMDTFGVYNVGGDTQAATYSSGSEANEYTFIMPGENVTIKADFKQISTKKQIHRVDVTMMPVENVQTGFAVPKATSTTDGVEEEVKVTWRFNNKEIDYAVFQDAGIYEYEFTAKAKDGYELASDVVYVLNGADKPLTDAKGRLDVTERSFSVTWDNTGDNGKNVAQGLMTISGTSASKYYMIQLSDINKDTMIPTSAFVIAEGGNVGKIEVPCSKNMTVYLTEMNGTATEDYNKGYTFVSEWVANKTPATIISPKEAASKAYGQTDNLNNGTNERTSDGMDNSARSASWKSDTNVASGTLTLTGVNAEKYYMIQLQDTDPTTYLPVSAFVLAKGSDTQKLEVPCAKNATVFVTEMSDTSNEAYSHGTPFVDGLPADKNLHAVNEGSDNN